MQGRRTRFIAASAAVMVALAVLIVFIVRSSSDDPADAAAGTDARGTATQAETEPGAAAEGDGEAGTGPADEAGVGAEADPLAVAPDGDPGVSDEIALDTFCSVDTEVLDGLPRLYGDGEVTADGLRDALVLLDDRQQEWSFAAFGRPGFESLVTLVEDLEVQWQAALDTFDTGEPEAAQAELDDADAVLATIQARIDAAAVECP